MRHIGSVIISDIVAVCTRVSHALCIVIVFHMLYVSPLPVV